MCEEAAKLATVVCLTYQRTGTIVKRDSEVFGLINRGDWGGRDGDAVAFTASRLRIGGAR